MPAAQARALFEAGTVRIVPYTPHRDEKALHAIALWAHRFSPVVAVDHPDGLLLDLTGCERASGGEDVLVGRVLDDLARLGIRAKVAITPTFASAWALSRFSEEPACIVASDGLRDSLAPLPTAALDAEADTSDALHELGIERIEHLLELPRSALPARFGGQILFRLDQALGHALETIEPVRLPTEIEAERVFDGPTDRTEAVAMTVRELLDAICGQLRRASLGARSVEITLTRSDLEPEVLTITLGRPSRESGHLWKLAAPKLERAHLGYGVEAVRVAAPSTGRIRHEQLRCVGDDVTAPSSSDDLLDTLSNRLGAEGVLQAELIESHRPERSSCLRPLGRHRQIEGTATLHDRPTLVFEQPEPAVVVALTPDGPVHSVQWRGEQHQLIACVGPERLGSEWWRSRESTRDYFRVQTETGLWLWVARAIESNQWFVHGAWA